MAASDVTCRRLPGSGYCIHRRKQMHVVDLIEPKIRLGEFEGHVPRKGDTMIMAVPPGEATARLTVQWVDWLIKDGKSMAFVSVGPAK